jgi:hypothetical protein
MAKRQEVAKKQRTDQWNYDKYVRQLYRPQVSLKKQLELEHIKNSLKHKPLRKSTQDKVDGSDLGAEGKKGYPKPWRDAMQKKGRKDGKTFRDSMSNPLPDGDNSIGANDYQDGVGSVAGSPGALSLARAKKEKHPLTEGRAKTLGDSEQMSIRSGGTSTKKKDYLTELRLQRAVKE